MDNLAQDGDFTTYFDFNLTADGQNLGDVGLVRWAVRAQLHLAEGTTTNRLQEFIFTDARHSVRRGCASFFSANMKERRQTKREISVLQRSPSVGTLIDIIRFALRWRLSGFSLLHDDATVQLTAVDRQRDPTHTVSKEASVKWFNSCTKKLYRLQSVAASGRSRSCLMMVAAVGLLDGHHRTHHSLLPLLIVAVHVAGSNRFQGLGTTGA